MRIKTNYKIRKIAGESIIVAAGATNINTTTIITLNPTSEWLWEQLSGRDFTIEDVASLLCQEYEIDSERATADATKWVEQLRNTNLIDE